MHFLLGTKLNMNFGGLTDESQLKTSLEDGLQFFPINTTPSPKEWKDCYFDK